MNKLFPIFINLKNKRCTVIGGGNVALRKVKTLIEAEADIRIVSYKICEELKKLIDEYKLASVIKCYDITDLNNSLLVFACTNDHIVNTNIYNDCNKLNILVNVVDVPELCHFHVPCIVTRGDLKISISTNGKSPTIGKIIKSDLEKVYDESYVVIIQYFGKIREHLKTVLETEEERKSVLEKLSNNPKLIEYIRQNYKTIMITELNVEKEVQKWL